MDILKKFIQSALYVHFLNKMNMLISNARTVCIFDITASLSRRSVKRTMLSNIIL